MMVTEEQVEQARGTHGETGGGTHPVEDKASTRPLIKALRGHVDAWAAGLTEVAPKRRHTVAAAWVYETVLLAWAEDHGLVDPCLRAAARPARAAYQKAGGRALGWLARGIASLAVHPSTWCLLDPAWLPMREGRPAEKPAADLMDWWANAAPSFVYEHPTGPDSLTGWWAGDLLQHITDEQRKNNALCQTPWWVADFILDLTLPPAADEFRDQQLRVIDPTAGTGHFLMRAMPRLFELYTTGSMPHTSIDRPPVTGWDTVPSAQAIRWIATGLHGAELDPLTTAAARLRYTVGLGRLAHCAGLLGPGPLRLDRIPHSLQAPVIVCDSLLWGRMPWPEYAALHPSHVAIHQTTPDQAPAAWPTTVDHEGLAAFAKPAPKAARTPTPQAAPTGHGDQGTLFDLGEVA